MPRDAGVEPLGREARRQDGAADRDRMRVGLGGAPDKIDEAPQYVSPLGGEPKNRGQLTDGNMHGNASQKTGRYRDRQQVGDPAGPRQTRNDENTADGRAPRLRQHRRNFGELSR
jgi:hypothetical protein